MQPGLVSNAMAADSGGGQLQIDLDVLQARIAVTGELDLATVQVLRGPQPSSCRRRLARSPLAARMSMRIVLVGLSHGHGIR
jgi:hypothetical protein